MLNNQINVEVLFRNALLKRFKQMEGGGGQIRALYHMLKHC